MALKIFSQIARVMDTLHITNILRMDLKTSYVLVNMYSQEYYPENIRQLCRGFSMIPRRVGAGILESPGNLAGSKNKDIQRSSPSVYQNVACLQLWHVVLQSVEGAPSIRRGKLEYDKVQSGETLELPPV